MAAIDMIDGFLSEKRCTLWGRAFNVQSPLARREAAEWLQKQIRELQDYAEAQADEG